MNPIETLYKFTKHIHDKYDFDIQQIYPYEEDGEHVLTVNYRNLIAEIYEDGTLYWVVSDGKKILGSGESSEARFEDIDEIIRLTVHER